MNFPCPCCNFLTLTQKPPGTFETCPVCYWKDELEQFENPGSLCGPNSIPLHIAQKNFISFGASSKEWINAVRPPNSKELP